MFIRLVPAANGITAWLYPRLEPTPALSWAVRYLDCGAGICVTDQLQPAHVVARTQGQNRVHEGVQALVQGGYRLITGNEMGVLLLDYLCRTRIARNTMPPNPVAVTTIVSTDMATPVAQSYGVELRRTLTGFKYIGEQIGLLEEEGHPERYLSGGRRGGTS